MKIAPGADDIVREDSILIILGNYKDIEKLQNSKPKRKKKDASIIMS